MLAEQRILLIDSLPCDLVSTKCDQNQLSVRITYHAPDKVIGGVSANILIIEYRLNNSMD